MEQLTVPWSENPTNEEIEYKNAGFSRTVGTVFVKVPSNQDLENAFNIIDSSNYSIGTRFLQKYLHRNGQDVLGNAKEKNEFSKEYLSRFLSKSDSLTWKNIHQIDNRKIVEIRNNKIGFRWYLLDDGSCVFRGVLEPYPTYLQYAANKRGAAAPYPR